MALVPKVQSFILPNAQTSARYAPSELAEQLLNMEVSPDGTIRSVVGPCLYDPKHLFGGIADLGNMYGIHHHTAYNDNAELLLIAAGGTIYSHHVSQQGWAGIKSGVRSDPQAQFPVQFLSIGDYVIYFDGSMPAHVIDVNCRVFPLGFTETPGAPQWEGPRNPPFELKHKRATAAFGYSYPGGLGTPGDKLRGKDSGILAGEWQVCVVYLDALGNRSAPSPMSASVAFGPLRASVIKGVAGGTPTDSSVVKRQIGRDPEDMLRGAALRLPGDAPDHAVAMEIYQTPDMRNTGVDPRLAIRVGAVSGSVHGGWRDGELGIPLSRNRPVPIFHAATLFGGRLVVAEGSKVFFSEPGYYGSFPENAVVVPDDRGATITALASVGDRCLAFTRRSVIDISDPAQPFVVARGPGCCGPSAVCELPGFGLVFVGESAIYATNGSSVNDISGPIYRTMQHGVNRARTSQAVAWYDPTTGDARFALTPVGGTANTLILCFNREGGWREMQLGLAVNAVTVTRDSRPLQLVAGTDFAGDRGGQYTANDVYVLDYELPPSAYSPPDRVSRVRSAQISFSDDMLTEGLVIHVAVGFVETYQAAALKLRFRANQNDAWHELTADGSDLLIRLDDVVGPGANSGETRAVGWSVAQVGSTSTVPRRRNATRKATINARQVRTFQFELEAAYPVQLELRAVHIGYDVGKEELAFVPGPSDT